jgi:hypothetical protein
MANSLYTKAKQALIAADIDLDADDIRAVLVDSADYTPNLATHQFLSDIPVAARVAVSGALANKSVTGGVFDADDILISAVTGDQFEYVVLYQHTGNDATARLIYFIDTATGLPITPSGADVYIIWDNGANKIFALT